MKLYIVIDTKGDGRLVGVWDSKKIVNRLVKKFPAYYKMHIADLNKINPEVFSWTDTDEQKKYLEEMASNQRMTKK
jgi:serine/threonine protein phosphatase PrpC